MNYLSRKDIEKEEGLNKIYSMNILKNRKYHIFLYDPESPYDDSEGHNGELNYEGCTADWVNKEFYNRAKERPHPKTTIKVYQKDSKKSWFLKGYYKLVDAVNNEGIYEFTLIPLNE